ncbi:MAG: ATP synthase subunit I [Rhodoferax sp.]
MSIITPASELDADESEDWAPKRLSAEEAKKLRKLQPPVSPWRIVGLQGVVTLLVALLTWVVTGRSGAAWSAGYGGLAVLVPAALFARGLMSQFASINAVTAGFGFFVWEAIKIAVSVGMLFAAPRLVADLDWLAMLIGLIVTLKVYWMALLMRPKSKRIFSGD